MYCFHIGSLYINVCMNGRIFDITLLVSFYHNIFWVKVDYVMFVYILIILHTYV